MSERGWFRRDVTVGVTVYIIGTILGTGAIIHWRNSIWDWLVEAGKPTWRYLTTDHATPGWLLVVLWPLAAGFILVPLTVLILSSRASRSNDGRNYRQDTFFGLVWRWKYDPIADGGIDELGTYCPECQFQIYPIETRPDYPCHPSIICDYCGKESGHLDGTLVEIENRVKRLIQHKNRTGEWRQAVAQQ